MSNPIFAINNHLYHCTVFKTYNLRFPAFHIRSHFNGSVIKLHKLLFLSHLLTVKHKTNSNAVKKTQKYCILKIILQRDSPLDTKPCTTFFFF